MVGYYRGRAVVVRIGVRVMTRGQGEAVRVGLRDKDRGLERQRSGAKGGFTHSGGRVVGFVVRRVGREQG